jgi:hypothetical protein
MAERWSRLAIPTAQVPSHSIEPYMEVRMQPITSLGVAELSQDELMVVVGGNDECWCQSFKRGLGYAIGYALAELVDALVSPEDSNSFLGK